jgi:hypothetical protein
MPIELQKAAVALVLSLFFLVLNLKAGDTFVKLPTYVLMILCAVGVVYFAATWMW